MISEWVVDQYARNLAGHTAVTHDAREHGTLVESGPDVLDRCRDGLAVALEDSAVWARGRYPAVMARVAQVKAERDARARGACRSLSAFDWDRQQRDVTARRRRRRAAVSPPAAA